MSSASDKARFFLEQSVPELKEYERKKIFTSDEISSIARKRSDFEHKINARGSFPADYARYAEFEINVDALRRKRVKRLGIKAPAHNGQRRIFFVLDRGTRKFPGDVSLWMQSIEYARRQKAYKKLSKILTNVLRLHPMKSELWIYAAQFAIEENGDMTEARSYMQRGLRFCKSSKTMWLEYARLELVYIAKITARRQILGIGGDNQALAEKRKVVDTMDADFLHLPALTEDDISPDPAERDELDDAALRKLESTPALSGAIPKAIFDTAVSHFNHDPSIGTSFFDMVCEFDQIACRLQLLEHIDGVLIAAARTSWEAQACHIRLPVVGSTATSAYFPAAIATSLRRLKEALDIVQERKSLAMATKTWLLQLLEDEAVDPAVRKVLRSKISSMDKVD